MSDLAPRIDKVTGEFFKKGRCVVCGKQAERIKAIAGATMALMEAKGRAWAELPVMHKKCEIWWDDERHCVIGSPS